MTLPSLPRYAVAFANTAVSDPGALVVRAMVVDFDEAFEDGGSPVALRAEHSAIAYLDLFLQGLATGTAWLRRDHNSNGKITDAPVVDGHGRHITWYAASHLKRRPVGWHSLVVSLPANGVVGGDGDVLAELCTVSEDLAKGLYDALVAGTLTAAKTEEALAPAKS